ncbi:MAG: hypothetical protein VX528_08985 [Candidatus Latescibacterota bacterium]|nr:hypothetical protein [Candidatus Latescibacterota bacterium]MEC9379087.1 hypothetical protein [Candidatus Latescibacterota bacterium]MEE3042821.1 hypothetical protein [Candidatus Latescibacterota bacterium]
MPPDLQAALAEVRQRLDEILLRYDEAAGELLRVALLDGHFAGEPSQRVEWPSYSDGTVNIEGLTHRQWLITTIYDGIPSRREQRLGDAHDRFRDLEPTYINANVAFLGLRDEFVTAGRGDEAEFGQLYHTVYLDALARPNPVPLDDGEAALVEFRVARAPLAHAASVAGKISAAPAEDDPRWNDLYHVDGVGQASLRTQLRRIAEQVVDFLAAGEHLAIRYNCFSNFIWFGISVWKVVTDVELLAETLGGKVAERWRSQLVDYVRLLQGMLLEFLEAHLEDPAQIRPRDYWYGQQYSYLTRDMIDLTTKLVKGARRLQKRGNVDLAEIQLPPLLAGEAKGRYVDYPHVGASAEHGKWSRRVKLMKWVGLFRRRTQHTVRLKKQQLSDTERLQSSWDAASDWGRSTLDLFGVDVQITIDPRFAQMAQKLELASGKRRVVFFPTHQSLLDHPVMYTTLSSPQMIEAMGWDGPQPCSMLARAGLTTPTDLKIAGRTISLIGVDAKTADRLLEEIDGYVILDRSDDSAAPTARFAKVLEERPGVVYGAGTTSAYDLQVLPMQHALFAYLPADIVLVPIAMRGIHQLWPKCPAGNSNIRPGTVEVVVSPPIPGETTLLPRKRALRTQLEPATLFQAIHIAQLLNPNP